MKSKSCKLLSAALTSYLLVACGTQNQSNASSSLSATSDGQVQDWTDPMVTQRGYDVVSAAVKGDCTVPATLDPGIPGADGNVSRWRIDFIQTNEDLQKSLDISASARLTNALGTGTSPKVRYSNSLHVNSYSVFLLASVQVKKVAQNYRDVKLKPVYETLLNSQNPNKMQLFRQRCGDQFIIGQQNGGEYFTLIEIKTTSKEEKATIAASVQNKVSISSESSSFASTLNSLSNQYELHFFRFQSGGTSAPMPTEPQAIIERAVNFEKEIEIRSIPYKAIMADYETLENFPFEEPIATSNAVKAMEKLNELSLTIDTHRADIQYVLTNLSQFKSVDGAYLTGKINALDAAEQTILTAARTCARNIDACTVPTDLGDISVKLPE